MTRLFHSIRFKRCRSLLNRKQGRICHPRRSLAASEVVWSQFCARSPDPLCGVGGVCLCVYMRVYVRVEMNFKAAKSCTGCLDDLCAPAHTALLPLLSAHMLLTPVSPAQLIYLSLHMDTCVPVSHSYKLFPRAPCTRPFVPLSQRISKKLAGNEAVKSELDASPAPARLTVSLVSSVSGQSEACLSYSCLEFPSSLEDNGTLSLAPDLPTGCRPEHEVVPGWIPI